MKKITTRNSVSNFTRHLFFIVLLVTFCNALSAQVVFSEINYHSDTTRNSGEWLELYNADTASVDISNWIFSDSESIHYFVFPAGTILSPGGYLVLSNDTISFRNQYPWVTNVVGQFNFGLGNKGDTLRLFDVQSTLLVFMSYADSMGWAKAADGHGRTLEVRNPLGNLSDPANWYAGCMGGSPGSAPFPCSETLIFSEVNYHSSMTIDVGDWVELRNTSTQAIDISNWILRDKNDSNSFVIPPGTIIQPGEHLVLSDHLANFMYWFPGVTNVQGDFPFGLKNSKDVIRLYDSQGILYYSLAYRSDGYWPAQADGEGYTLELIDVSGIMNDGNNWMIGCVGGSPGRYFSSACDMLSVENAKDENNLNLYPNPFSSEAILEISGLQEDAQLVITDMLGRQVMDAVMVPAALGEVTRVELKRGNLSQGIYYYQLLRNNEQIGAGKMVIRN